jgi:hypothetical protein
MAHIDASSVGDLVVAEDRRDHRVSVVAELDVTDHDGGQRKDPEPTVSAIIRAPQAPELHRHERAFVTRGTDRDRLDSARVPLESGTVCEGRRDPGRILHQVHPLAAREDGERKQASD